MVCDAADAGMFAVAVTKPPLKPVQNCRPLSGPPAHVPLYPPTGIEPPAARMSWNAPPLIEISSTMPSNDDSVF
jgi:hypothetical protein